MKILSKEEFVIELNKIVTCGVNDIVIDLEDINQITKNKDLLVMSVFDFSANNAIREAINLTILDFEKNKLLLKEADGILVYFQVNSNYEIMEISVAMDIIYDKCVNKYMLEEPDIIFGTSCDNSLSDEYVKVTVFMGYSKKQFYVNNYIEKPVI